MKYNLEKKVAALARMNQIGVAKTSEEMSISVQTLYKWRNEGETEEIVAARPEDGKEALRQVIQNGERQMAAIKRLEDENTQLRDENAKLLQENVKLKIVVKAFIG